MDLLRYSKYKILKFEWLLTTINFENKRLVRSRTTRSGSENFDFSD